MNWSVQNAIVAFVDSMKPNWPSQQEAYLNALHGFVHMQSEMLTTLGYPPVP